MVDWRTHSSKLALQQLRAQLKRRFQGDVLKIDGGVEEQMQHLARLVLAKLPPQLAPHEQPESINVADIVNLLQVEQDTNGTTHNLC